MRHRGRLRVPSGPDHAAPGPRVDGEDDRAPRPRPGRHLPGRAHRARRAAAQDHRPVARGLPARPERGRHDPARLQRRDLQSRAPPAGAPGARPPLPGPLRLRDGGARLRGVGSALRRALPRILRVRALGQRPRRAPAGPRPDRDQARSTTRGRRTAWSSAPRSRRSSSTPTSRGRWTSSPCTTTSATSSCRGRRRCSRGSGSCRPGPSRGSAAGSLEIEPYWELRFADAPDDAADPGPPRARDAPGLRARVDDVGRPGGRVPLRRARLDGGPGLHAGGHDRAAPDVHARLRRSHVQRVGVRARGRALLRDRAPRDPGAPRHARRDRADRLAPRRADDRSVGGAALPPVPGGAPRRHRLHVRARAGTRSSSATTGSSRRRRTASTGCCRAPSGAASSSPWSPGCPIRSRRRGRSSSCAGSSRAPASTPARFTCAGSTSGPMRSTDASSGIPCSGRWTGTASRRSARRPPAATRTGSSTARSSWTPGSRCPTRC